VQVEKTEMMPDGWNASQDVYTLHYVPENSDNSTHLLKVVKAGRNLLVHVMVSVQNCMHVCVLGSLQLVKTQDVSRLLYPGRQPSQCTYVCSLLLFGCVSQTAIVIAVFAGHDHCNNADSHATYQKAVPWNVSMISCLCSAHSSLNSTRRDWSNPCLASFNVIELLDNELGLTSMFFTVAGDARSGVTNNLPSS